MRQGLLWSVFCVVGLAAGVACGGMPVEVLDQSSTMTDAYFHVISPGYSTAQTFTVGVSGTLSRTEMWMFRRTAGTQPLELEIRAAGSGADGAPMGAKLASVVLQPADLPYDEFSSSIAPISVDWSFAGIKMAVGDRYALVAASNEPYAGFEGYWWRSTSQGHDVYAGGAAWLSGSGDAGPWTKESGASDPQDYWLQTYVTVPAPGGGAGVVVLGGMALLRRRGRGELI